MLEAVEYLKDRKRKQHKFTWEVIVADDGSTDRTWEVSCDTVRSAGLVVDRDVKCAHLVHNRGKGGAIIQVSTLLRRILSQTTYILNFFYATVRSRRCSVRAEE